MMKRCCGCMKLKQNTPICEHCGYDETRNNESHQLPCGTVLRDKYVVGRVLGQGGFGITYLGWDTLLETPVAIKEYYPSGLVTRDYARSLSVTAPRGDSEHLYRSARDRFLREAKALARLGSVPEIVRIHNFFEENNTAYIIMEYLDGMELRHLVHRRGGKLSPEETFSLLKPVMKALTIVHKEGLIHRDISPDNIMILPGGGVKLLDFGAVRDVDVEDARQELPVSTQAILKYGFTPIEQYQRRGSLGPWTDVYALCATMYYCMTGFVPPEAPDRILRNASFSWQQVPGLTDRQISALEKGMAPWAQDRFATVEELYDALFAQIPEPQTASDPPAPITRMDSPALPKKPRSAVKKPALIAAVLVLAVLAAGILWSRQKEDTPQLGMPLTGENSSGTRVRREPWRSNVLKSDYIKTEELEEAYSLPVFGSAITRQEIRTVTFLDTLAQAPEDSWDVSRDGDGRVLAWATKNGEYYDLYLAAEGGINGAEACLYLFRGYRNVVSIQFNGCFHTQTTQRMACMFSGCESLTELDLSDFDTANVTNMRSMFYHCAGLTQLDVSGFDTSRVTDMSHMFCGCTNLAELDLSSLETGSVTDMSYLFYGCTRLEALDVSNFDTAQVTDMKAMFYQCSGLTQLDVSGFDTGKVVDMSHLFFECSSLTELDVTGFDTSNVTTMKSMFTRCQGVRTFDIRSFETGNVTDMRYMFYQISPEAVIHLDETRFDTSNVTQYKDFCSSDYDWDWEELFS